VRFRVAAGAAVAERLLVTARTRDRETVGVLSEPSGRFVLKFPADAPGPWRLEAGNPNPDRTVRGAADVTVPTNADVRVIVAPLAN